MAAVEKENYWDLVFEVTRLIPEGRVSTYGAIADYLALGSARMVGWALNRVKASEMVPAHRVVNSKGELSGRAAFHPPSAMQDRLESEGVEVKNDKVVNFKALFWHPAQLDTIL